MVETKVILCDVCKQKVSKDKCMICKSDICNNPECKREIKIKIEGDGKAITKLTYCDEHGKILRRRINQEFLNSDILENIRTEINGYFMKKLTSQGLKEQNEKMSKG